MSSIPADLKYLDSHEWARVESDGTVTIGISDHAQGALGDLVFVEVPEVGKALNKGGAAAVVESVKAASDVYSPVSGEVIAANDALSGAPELVNSDPYGQGWLFKVKPEQQRRARAAARCQGVREGRRGERTEQRRVRRSPAIRQRSVTDSHALHSPHRSRRRARCWPRSARRASMRCSRRFRPRCASSRSPAFPKR